MQFKFHHQALNFDVTVCRGI